MLDRAAFLAELAEILDVDAGTLTPGTELGTLENWDSVAHLSAMVLIDEKCGVAIAPDALISARTVSDLMRAAGHGIGP